MAQGNPCYCFWSLVDGSAGCFSTSNCGGGSESACSTHVANEPADAWFIGFQNANTVPSSWDGSVCDWFVQLVLPVELIEFKAKSIAEDVLIEWRTASERNNHLFRVFYSTDGQDWEVLGDVSGAGNSSQELHYQLVHKNAPNGIIYYQLKQQDYDSTKEFFPIISLDRSSTEKTLIGTYDLLGRKVSSDNSGIIIYRYSDGSSLKVYNE